MTDDSTLELLLIDSDPIFRLGLLTALQQFRNLQVVAEANTCIAARDLLAAGACTIPDLVILDVALDSTNSTGEPDRQTSLQLCWQLKTQYPNLPVLLLSAIQETIRAGFSTSCGY